MLARARLLILDDWGPEALNPDQAHDLLEIVEDRYDKVSIVITSQNPLERWRDLIGVPTPADAILDRVIHNAVRIERIGESLRRRRSPSRPLRRAPPKRCARPENQTVWTKPVQTNIIASDQRRQTSGGRD
jgi:IstB-like ATP binding protein